MRTAAQAASLVFCAWWLVATSAPIVPARDCFSGIANPTKLKVVLGPATGSASDQIQGCQGLDGLMPGKSVTLSLSQGPRPEASGAPCYDFDTDAIEGADGVTLSSGPAFGSEGLTSAYAMFSSAQFPGCQGGWHFLLRPADLPPHGQTIKPLDAGPNQRWFVERTMGFDQGEKCGGALTGSGQVECEDQFVVESIAGVNP